MLGDYDEAEAKFMKAEPLDVTADDFAEFALDQVEEFDRLQDREPATLVVQGQEIRAVVLGFGSSYPVTENGKEVHTHNPTGPPLKGVPCTFCRWADITILRLVPEGDAEDDNVPMYVLVTVGQTVVEGEDVRVNSVWSPDAMEILKHLYVDGRTTNTATPRKRKIPFPNAVAFRRAAMVDKGIARVLDDHDDAIPSSSESGYRL